MIDEAPIRIAYLDPTTTEAEWEAFFAAERARHTTAAPTAAETLSPTEPSTITLPEATTAPAAPPTDTHAHDADCPTIVRQTSDLRLHSTTQLLATATGLAHEQAEHLLHACDHTLKAISGKQQEWYEAQGLSPQMAERLCATFELARRWASTESNQPLTLNSSRAIAAYMARYLVDLDHEEVWIVALSPTLTPLAKVCLTHGGMSEVVIDLRLTLLEVLRAKATHFVLLHNHPNGAAVPSRADDVMTERLYHAAQQVDLKLIDHIIIGQGVMPLGTATSVATSTTYNPVTDAPTEHYAYYSYADKGAMPF